MTNGQLYTGVNILAEGPRGMFFKGEWRPTSKTLVSLRWWVMQSLVLLHHMQLHRQAHPYPISEGLFKTKNAAAAVLPVK